MINSFLQCNKWFRGEIVIITSDTEYIQKKIEKFRLKINLVKPSEELFEKIELLKDQIKNFQSIRYCLFKLELFNLSEYDIIIYYDSDMQHLQEIDSSIILKKDLLVVKDPWFYRGYKRNRRTLEKIKITDESKETYEIYFNSGFMAIGKKFLNQKVYQKLISVIVPGFFANIDDIPADEPVLNKILENEFDTVPVIYNCPVHLLIEGVVKQSVNTIHFTGRYKPWILTSWFILLRRSIKYLKPLYNWLLCYFRYRTDR